MGKKDINLPSYLFFGDKNIDNSAAPPTGDIDIEAALSGEKSCWIDESASSKLEKKTVIIDVTDPASNSELVNLLQENEFQIMFPDKARNLRKLNEDILPIVEDREECGRHNKTVNLMPPAGRNGSGSDLFSSPELKGKSRAEVIIINDQNVSGISADMSVASIAEEDQELQQTKNASTLLKKSSIELTMLRNASGNNMSADEVNKIVNKGQTSQLKYSEIGSESESYLHKLKIPDSVNHLTLSAKSEDVSRWLKSGNAEKPCGGLRSITLMEPITDATLVEILKKAPNLETIDLRNGLIKQQGTTVKFDDKDFPKLVNINIGNTNKSQQFMEFIKAIKKIKTISVDFKDDNESFRVFDELTQKLTTLDELSFSYKCLAMQSDITATHVLFNTPSLKTFESYAYGFDPNIEFDLPYKDKAYEDFIFPKDIKKIKMIPQRVGVSNLVVGGIFEHCPKLEYINCSNGIEYDDKEMKKPTALKYSSLRIKSGDIENLRSGFIRIPPEDCNNGVHTWNKNDLGLIQRYESVKISSGRGVPITLPNSDSTRSLTLMSTGDTTSFEAPKGIKLPNLHSLNISRAKISLNGLVRILNSAKNLNVLKIEFRDSGFAPNKEGEKEEQLNKRALINLKSFKHDMKPNDLDLLQSKIGVNIPDSCVTEKYKLNDKEPRMYRLGGDNFNNPASTKDDENTKNNTKTMRAPKNFSDTSILPTEWTGYKSRKVNQGDAAIETGQENPEGTKTTPSQDGRYGKEYGQHGKDNTQGNKHGEKNTPNNQSGQTGKEIKGGSGDDRNAPSSKSNSSDSFHASKEDGKERIASMLGETYDGNGKDDGTDPYYQKAGSKRGTNGSPEGTKGGADKDGQHGNKYGNGKDDGTDPYYQKAANKRGANENPEGTKTTPSQDGRYGKEYGEKNTPNNQSGQTGKEIKEGSGDDRNTSDGGGEGYEGVSDLLGGDLNVSRSSSGGGLGGNAKESGRVYGRDLSKIINSKWLDLDAGSTGSEMGVASGGKQLKNGSPNGSPSGVDGGVSTQGSAKGSHSGGKGGKDGGEGDGPPSGKGAKPPKGFKGGPSGGMGGGSKNGSPDGPSGGRGGSVEEEQDTNDEAVKDDKSKKKQDEGKKSTQDDDTPSLDNANEANAADAADKLSDKEKAKQDDAKSPNQNKNNSKQNQKQTQPQQPPKPQKPPQPPQPQPQSQQPQQPPKPQQEAQELKGLLAENKTPTQPDDAKAEELKPTPTQHETQKQKKQESEFGKFDVWRGNSVTESDHLIPKLKEELAKKGNKNILITCSSQKQISELRAELLGAFPVTRTEREEIVDESKQLAFPLTTFAKKDNKIEVKDKTNGNLYRFITDAYGNRILFVDWSTFNASDTLQSNSILDAESRLEGKSLDGIKIISMQNTSSPLAYLGGDFMSRQQSTINIAKDVRFNSALSNNLIDVEKLKGDEFIIDAKHAPSWKVKLCGICTLNGNDAVWKPGKLVEALESNRNIVIVNPPKLDGADEAMRRFIEDIQRKGFLEIHGKKIPVPKGIKISFAESRQKVKVEDVKSVAEFTPWKSSGSDICIHNSTFSQLKEICHIDEKGNAITEEGWMAKHKGKTLPIRISAPLSDVQWSDLVKMAKEYNVHLKICIDKKVKTPFKLDPKELYDAKNNFGSNRALVSSDLGYTIEKLKQQSPETLFVNVSEITNDNLIFSVGNETRFENGKCKFEFSVKNGAVTKALLEGRNVCLYGEINDNLLSDISSILANGTININGKAIKTKGNLTIVPDKDMPVHIDEYPEISAADKINLLKKAYGTKANNVTQKMAETNSFNKLAAFIRSEKQSIEDVWKDLQILENDSTTKVEDIKLDSKSVKETKEKFDEERLNIIKQSVKSNGMTFIVGIAGTGKTTMFNESKELRKFANIHTGLDSIKEWVKSGQNKGKGKDDDKYEILYIDEGNIGQSDYSYLESGLFVGGEIIIEGQVFKLSDKHRVVLTGNPDEYSKTRNTPKIIKEHGGVCKFKPIEPAVLYGNVMKVIFQPFLEKKEEIFWQNVSKTILSVYQEINNISKLKTILTPRALQAICQQLRQMKDEQVLGIGREEGEDRDFTNKELHDVMMLSTQFAVPEEHRVDVLAILSKRFNIPSPEIKLTEEQEDRLADKGFYITNANKDLLVTLGNAVELRSWKMNERIDGESKQAITSAKNTPVRQAGGTAGVIIEGRPGLGKSAAARAILETKGFKEFALDKFDMKRTDQITRAQHHRGFAVMPNQATQQRKEQILHWAFNNGVTLIFDELNSLQNAPLEKNINAYCCGKDINGLKPARSGFFMLATQNSAAEFEGRSELSEAMLSRMVVVEIKEHNRDELKVITKKLKPSMKDEDMNIFIDQYMRAKEYAEVKCLTQPNFRDYLRVLGRERVAAVSQTPLKVYEDADYIDPQDEPITVKQPAEVQPAQKKKANRGGIVSIRRQRRKSSMRMVTDVMKRMARDVIEEETEEELMRERQEDMQAKTKAELALSTKKETVRRKGGSVVKPILKTRKTQTQTQTPQNNGITSPPKQTPTSVGEKPLQPLQQLQPLQPNIVEPSTANDEAKTEDQNTSQNPSQAQTSDITSNNGQQDIKKSSPPISQKVAQSIPPASQNSGLGTDSRRDENDDIRVKNFSSLASRSRLEGRITEDIKDEMLAIIKQMTDVNHNINWRGAAMRNRGETILSSLASARCGIKDEGRCAEILRAIYSRGGDINIESGFLKSTPLYQAIEGGNREVAALIIKTFGSKINYESRDRKGNNFAHILLINGYITRPNILRLFDKGDARSAISLLSMVIRLNPSIVNSKMSDGNTPLHIACMKRDLGAVELLLNSGSDATAVNNNGLSPQNMLQMKYDEVEQYLSKHAKFFHIFKKTHSNEANLKEIENLINIGIGKSDLDARAAQDEVSQELQNQGNKIRGDNIERTSKVPQLHGLKPNDRMLSRYRSSEGESNEESFKMPSQKSGKSSKATIKELGSRELESRESRKHRDKLSKNMSSEMLKEYRNRSAMAL